MSALTAFCDLIWRSRDRCVPKPEVESVRTGEFHAEEDDRPPRLSIPYAGQNDKPSPATVEWCLRPKPPK
jgi:hypothetical protein